MEELSTGRERTKPISVLNITYAICLLFGIFAAYLSYERGNFAYVLFLPWVLLVPGILLSLVSGNANRLTSWGMLAMGTFATVLASAGMIGMSLTWALVFMGVGLWVNRKWLRMALRGWAISVLAWNAFLWLTDIQPGFLSLAGWMEKTWISVGVLLFVSLGFIWIRQLMHALNNQHAEHQLLKTLVDTLPVEILALDEENRHVFINREAIPEPELRQQMIGKTPEDYANFRNRPRPYGKLREQKMNEVRDSGIATHWEETFDTPFGKAYFTRHLNPVFDEKGKFRFLAVHAVDVSETRRVEEKVRENEAIQRSISLFATSQLEYHTEEDILWDITENCIKHLNFVDCVIFLVDEERQVLVQKAAYGQKNQGKKEIYQPLEIPIGKGIVGTVAQTGKAEHIENTQMDARYILDDEIRLSELAVPIIGPQKQILGVIDSEYHEAGFFTSRHLEILTVIASICAHKLIKTRANQALVQAKEDAEAAMHAKSRFLSTMSHEIRTPMNAVIGIANILEESNPRPDQVQSIQALHFSAKHLFALLNDILDYSKIDSGRLELEEQEFNLCQLMRGLHQTFSVQAREKNIDLTIRVPERINTLIRGDSMRLNQILTNLIGNAIKFTREGEVSFGYDIEQQDTVEAGLFFWVKDTGIGIPQEKQALIFEQFRQASALTTRQYGGTGLGLAISKKLVEIQGGEIGLESTQGEGALFWFRLSYPAGAKIDETNDPCKQEKWSKGSLEGMRILMVEDNEINTLVGQTILERWNTEVSTAENGQIAVEMVEKGNYDAILMDLDMPVMDGMEATRIIRSMPDETRSRIPIIALTADVSAETKTAVLGLGMNHYATKPLEPAELFRILQVYRPIRIS